MDDGTMAEGRGLKEKVALACRMLEQAGHGDYNLGHVAARAGQGMYMKPAGLGLGEVTADDILTLDLDGRVQGGRHPSHSEWPIHAAILRARPEVQAVVHTHPPFATAYSCLGREPLVLNQDGVLFAGGVAIFDQTPDLVNTPALGEALARRLGKGQAALLQNHGLVTVGTSVEEATYLAISLEKSLHTQWIAAVYGLAAGTAPAAIAAEVAGRMRAEALKPARVAGIWHYLARRLDG